MWPKLLVVSSLLALSGCLPALVFVPYHRDLKPEPQAAGSPCTGPEIDSLIAHGDEFRDKLLAPLAPMAVSKRLSRDEIEAAIKATRASVQEELNQRYQMWRNGKRCYETALAQDPSLSYAHLSMAVIAMRMSDFVYVASLKDEYFIQAKNSLKRAQEANRFDPQVRYYQAELEVRRGNYRRATEMLDEIGDKWQRAHQFNLRGYIHKQNNDETSAAAEWKKATELDTPALANEWAIEKVRTPVPFKPDKAEDDLTPKRFYRWDPTGKVLLPLVTLPPAPCGWTVTGRSRCKP